MAWAAGSGGARRALSSHTLLFDLPPALLGEFCAVLDSCDGALGWRGLGDRNNVVTLYEMWHYGVSSCIKIF
ncbi:hypothetical protein FD754_010362 [Muntiacus muntjak]|uniref:Uncharacterized protein n=1 Tax=Muntiacus muntjak TaxID=9888 RepID=A0A5N3X1C0_MUNMU|nr:hypothetical protein FD754_010362 [Muntiacus muntjak]